MRSIALQSLVTMLLPVLLAACDETPMTRAASAPATELIASLRTGKSVIDLSSADVTATLQSPLRPGLSAWELADPDGQLLVVAAGFDLLRPRLLGVTASEPQGVIPDDLVDDDAIAMLIGSGFVSELMALKPLGLLQIEGEVVSRIQRHGYTRILGVGERKLGVVDHLQYERGLYPSAMQVGPGVIEHGRLDISERDLERPAYFRALIATCGETTLFVASLTPMHLHAIGRSVLKFASEQRLTCDELVNLAGDREAVLGVRLADARMLFIGNPRTSRAALVTLESVALDAIAPEVTPIQ
jgi:hypothetical protein